MKNQFSTLIATRSMSRLLSKKSCLLVQEMQLPHKRFSGTSATGYLKLILAEEFDCIINLDEDAFVTDIEELKLLLEFVIEEGFTNVGMPDGGMVSIRQHNPCVTNPFFNIFNLSELRQTDFSGDKIFSLEERKSIFASYPITELSAPYDLEPFESYEDLLLEVYLCGKTLWLRAQEFEDGISTVVFSHRNRPFLIHTWYAREFLRSSLHRNRISNVFSISSGGQRMIADVSDIWLLIIDVLTRGFRGIQFRLGKLFRNCFKSQ